MTDKTQSSEEKNISDYDCTSQFNSVIVPILKHLKIMCIEYKIPMFVSFAVKNDSKKTEYVNDIVMACTEHELTDNRINKMLLRINKFQNEYPEYVKNAYAVLQNYLDNYEASFSGRDSADAGELADDMLDDLMLIGEGLMEETPTAEMLKKPASQASVSDTEISKEGEE